MPRIYPHHITAEKKVMMTVEQNLRQYLGRGGPNLPILQRCIIKQSGVNWRVAGGGCLFMAKKYEAAHKAIVDPNYTLYFADITNPHAYYLKMKWMIECYELTAAGFDGTKPSFDALSSMIKKKAKKKAETAFALMAPTDEDHAQTACVAQATAQSAKSTYTGVCWGRSAQKWTAQIKIKSKQQHLGYFFDDKAAARAYDRACVDTKLDRPLNFPDDHPAYKATSTPPRRSSKYTGVRNKRDKQWVARITINKKETCLGSFDDEKKAARAYDKACVNNKLGRALNFPAEHSGYKKTKKSVRAAPTRKRKMASVKAKPGRRSKYSGLAWSKRCAKWCVHVWEDETRKQKGQFADEQEAAKAYDDYCHQHDLGWPLNFPARLGSLYKVSSFPNKHNPNKRKPERGGKTKPRKKPRKK